MHALRWTASSGQGVKRLRHCSQPLTVGIAPGDQCHEHKQSFHSIPSKLGDAAIALKNIVCFVPADALWALRSESRGSEVHGSGCVAKARVKSHWWGIPYLLYVNSGFKCQVSHTRAELTGVAFVAVSSRFIISRRLCMHGAVCPHCCLAGHAGLHRHIRCHKITRPASRRKQDKHRGNYQKARYAGPS